MNKISYVQVSGTFSFVLLTAGLLASLQLQATNSENSVNHDNSGLMQSSYVASGHKPTFNTLGSPIVVSYELAPNELEHAVGNFYARLLASQEPLGAEFEKVLYANLWDLYES